MADEFEKVQVTLDIDSRDYEFLMRGIHAQIAVEKGEDAARLNQLRFYLEERVTQARISAKENYAYISRNFANRDMYLESLAAEYDLDLAIVQDLAAELGEEEDFDMLPLRLSEIADGMELD